MYALLRKAKLVVPSAAEEATRRAQEGIVPVLRSQPSFLLHLGFISETCEAIGVTLFEDREAAQAALLQLQNWAVTGLVDLITGEQEVRCGAVLHHHAAVPGHGLRPEEALFITVREYEGVAPTEDAILRLGERVLPIIERPPGFRGSWAFRDEGDASQVVIISLWANRGTAMSAHERVAEAMEALRDLFPSPPRITAGAARVVAARDLG